MNHRLGEGRLLKAFIVACLAACLLLCTAGLTAAQASQPRTATPIKHVIIVTMENHSFDNVFGAYPSGGTSPFAAIAGNITVPDNLLGLQQPSLAPVPPGSMFTANPVEGYTAYHLDWNGGAMDGFQSNSGKQSMTYFTAAQMGAEWVLAQQFALGDMYFSSTLTATMPNRLYSIAGFSPVINDYGLPPYIPFSQSIFGELQHYGISWAYYIAHPSEGLDVLSYLQGISQYSSNVRSWSSFMSELSNNTLPSVSYISPIGFDVSGYSQHPSDSMAVGEMWLYVIVDSVMHSPEWNSTALFINYDEGGGYYDHVPPPVVGGEQLGFRVPLLLISPYAKENYVSGTVMNHASLLAFIDYNWNLPALNSFVSASDLPLDMFFGLSGGAVPRPPITLPAMPGFDLQTSLYFQQSAVSAANLSSLFPVQPQIPYGSLPYSRTGSTNFSMAQSSQNLFVGANSAYTPWYESAPLLAFMMAAVLVASFVLLSSRRR